MLSQLRLPFRHLAQNGLGVLTPLRQSSSVDFVPPQTFANPAGTEKWHEKVSVPGGQDSFIFPAFNKRIHPPVLDQHGQLLVRPAYCCHMRTMIKYSQKKLWYIASFVRGLTVEEALKQLTYRHMNAKGAMIVSDIIREAQELAVQEHNVEFKTNLWVAESFTEKAEKVKGMRRHARGRMALLDFEFQNYFVRLEEGAPPKDYYEWRREKRPEELLENYVAEQRKRTIVFQQ
ncbi:hypothetical protein TCAL_13866 [Tigriopus californicus]|uniref:Large ribosomal subunit protein uL22m n=1 Tax=Tigriopus californicus TaxID=6832 RepID=A0A553N8T8_TIGCA|nr:large ribosomal subunit protein uL22m-like [Tigriopus californicus]TRY61856.1 hypothetical protein TCAL_13866 [Tigriopus californicus]